MREELATIRQHLNIEPDEFAARLGLSEDAYLRLESGADPISRIHILAAQAAALDAALSCGDAFGLTPEFGAKVKQMTALMDGEHRAAVLMMEHGGA